MSKRAKELPPIPDTVGAVLGPIAVSVVPSIEDDECNGLWLSDPRTIQIRSGLSLTEQWWTLHHEIMHAILHDCGVSTLPEPDEEAVCNAYATARLLEMQGRAWTPRKRAPRIKPPLGLVS